MHEPLGGDGRRRAQHLSRFAAANCDIAVGRESLSAPTDLTLRRTSAVGRWSILAVSVFATSVSFLLINGVAFLIPALEAQRGISLAEAGLLASMPSWGMVCSLVVWGYVVDHCGERVVLTAGSALAAAATYAAASAQSMTVVGVYLFLGGMAAASSNTAGGRLVATWFSTGESGLAMGIRQTAQPLGIALGALLIPPLALHGFRWGIMLIAALCAAAALMCYLRIGDPPRESRRNGADDAPANPYRGTSVLWRIHAVSGLLMLPQTVTVSFMLVWLIHHQHWSVGAAGALVTLAQLLGAAGRIAVGRWSDVIGSRMRPVRAIAVTAAVTLCLLAVSDSAGSTLDVPLMLAISVIAMLDNGLEAAAITDYAGPLWSGRALGIQNTAQRVVAAAGIPLFGALINVAAYPPAWIVCGVSALAAIPLVPDVVRPPIPAREREVAAS